MKFDIFIPCAQKDYNKLPYVMDSIRRNVDFGGTIHVSVPFDLDVWIYSDVVFHHDKEVLDIDNSKWKHRPSWMYQQCLKLFQIVTSDLYLVVDCDTIFNRPVPFFDGLRKVWYTGWHQYHMPYFRFQKEMIGIGKPCRESMIADIGFYDRKITSEMLVANGYTVKSFIQKAQSITTPECYMCEQDIYAGYCYVNKADEYVFKPLKMIVEGHVQYDPAELIYSKEKIEKKIEDMKSRDCDTFALHSWLDEPENKKCA
jgi:hypothetical protein